MGIIRETGREEAVSLCCEGVSLQETWGTVAEIGNHTEEVACGFVYVLHCMEHIKVKQTSE